MNQWKIKFRVFEIKKCRKCRRIHEAPTNRYVFGQAEGTEHEVIQKTHASWVHILKGEKGRRLRPWFQYSLELS
jgi:hypothetical protein